MKTYKLLLVLLVCSLSISSSADVIYVDVSASGANDGSSWLNAFNNLQTALDSATETDQIWVAQGIYLPTTEIGGTGDRYRTFQLKNSVTLYGGFPTGGASLDERNPLIYETIASGDLNQDDGENFTNSSDNCYHVFYHPSSLALNSNAVLDGFVICGGYADGSSPHNYGGGIYCNNCDIRIYNCQLRDNFAQMGGAIYCEACEPRIENSIISFNNSSYYGGGIACYTASPTIANSVLYANNADSSGGGVYDGSSSALEAATIANCILWANTNSTSGDQIYDSGTTSMVSYCDVEGGFGGNNLDTDPLFVDAAAGDFHLGYSSPCIDAGNNSSTTLSRDIEGDNRIINSSVDIGADEVNGYALTVNIEPTPAGEVSLSPDYKLYADGTTVTLTSSSNTGYTFDNWSGNVNSSLNPITLTMDSDKTVVCNFTFSGDVLFVDDDSTAASPDGSSWASAFPSLQQALDVAQVGDQIWVASGTYKPTKRIDASDARSATFQLQNAIPIFGGFAGTENPSTFNLSDRDFVANETILSGDIGLPGGDFDNCYHVFYHPVSSALTNSAILDGVTVTGANANGSQFGQSNGGGMYNYTSSPTIKNCIFTGNKASLGAGMYNYKYSSASISNSTFSDNIAANNDATPHGSGGGIFNSIGCDTYLADCLFINNTATNGEGGGVKFEGGGTPTVISCRFEANNATTGGALLISSNVGATVTNSKFIDNTGGAVDISQCSPRLESCIFKGNSRNDGAAIRCFKASPKVTNCLFFDNTATNAAIIHNMQDCYGEFTNCVLANNTNTTTNYGVVYNFSNCHIKLNNCILWANTSNAIVDSNGGSSEVNNCDIQGGYAGGTGNIDANPNFVDISSGDYHLQASSPCIDSGADDAVSTSTTTDLNGNNRFVDGNCDSITTVDMGCYEFSHRYSGDLNDDCAVDILDMALLANSWDNYSRDYDIATGYGDGIIDISDLSVIASNWLEN